jgi:hypothetical protein
MALHKNQTEKAVAPIQAFEQTDSKMDLAEDNRDATEMLDRTPPKELMVSNPVLHHRADIIDGPPLKPVPGDELGMTPLATTVSGDVDAPQAITKSGDVDAPPAITESGEVDAPPAITESCYMEVPPAISGPEDTDMVEHAVTKGPDEDIEVVASPAITEPDNNMEDVAPPAIAVPVDGQADGAPELIIEHSDVLQEASSAIEDSADTMEVVHPDFTEQSGQGKDDAPAVACPPNGQETVSIMNAGVVKDMQGDINGPEDPAVNASSVVSELDVVASGAQDCEGLLVEGRVNLSRIPNSPESTH